MELGGATPPQVAEGVARQPARYGNAPNEDVLARLSSTDLSGELATPMSFSTLQTRRFARQYKKLNDNMATDVDSAVESVCRAPHSGDRKKGDLSDLWVYKLKSQGQLYLLGHTLDAGVRRVYLEAIGPHENFYRDRKRTSFTSVQTPSITESTYHFASSLGVCPIP